MVALTNRLKKMLEVAEIKIRRFVGSDKKERDYKRVYYRDAQVGCFKDKVREKEGGD